MDELRLRATSEFSRDAIGFYLFEKPTEMLPKIRVGTSIDMEEMTQAAYISPTFSLSHDACQVLIDSLWDVGIRPTEGKGSAGQLTATEYHLEDMRKLALPDDK